MIVPSRGRPHNILGLMQAWQETEAAATLLVAVDEDDKYLPAYRRIKPRCSYLLEVNPRLRMVGTLNEVAVRHAGEYFAIGFMGDDHRPRTQHWDRRYVAALREFGTGVVYGDDLLQGENLPTQVAMTSDIVQALGYMAPPRLQHLYVDNAWLTLGQQLDRIRYLPDVIVEHMHPIAGKAELDQGYADVNAPQVYARDHDAFQRWLVADLPEVLPRLRKLVTP